MDGGRDLIWDPVPVRGRLVARVNRFAAAVAVDGRDALAHVANSGRLEQLMRPGAEVLLRPAVARLASARATSYDLLCVELGAGGWACADARVPAPVFAEAVAAGALPEFAGYRVARAEPRFGRSRFDLLLEPSDARGGRPILVETKSVTLVEEGRALFPDAPTARGARHLADLIEATRRGYRAAVVFVAQREDADRFAPHDRVDPALGAALRAAAAAGVHVRAYRCRVDDAGIRLAAPLPTDIGSPL